MDLNQLREALRKLPPQQLRELLAEFGEVRVASDKEVLDAADAVIDQYKPALKRLADR